MLRHKPLDKLSVEELEGFIRQRRDGVAPTSTPTGTPAKTKSRNPLKDRRKRKGWEKALFLAEIFLIAGLLAVFGISTRGWMALRQQLPVEGITLIDETVVAASPAEIEDPSAPLPIGWRNSPMADLAAPAEARPQNQPLETPEHLKRWLQPGSSNPPPLNIPNEVVRAATRIVIPSIGVDAPIGEDTEWE